MNGGAFHAVDIMDRREFDDAIAGYQFFGLTDITVLLAKARDLLHESVDIEEHEALLDCEYASIIPNDSFLFSVFERYFNGHPGDFVEGK
jgi:hypothetical protein